MCMLGKVNGPGTTKRWQISLCVKCEACVCVCFWVCVKSIPGTMGLWLRCSYALIECNLNALSHHSACSRSQAAVVVLVALPLPLPSSLSSASFRCSVWVFYVAHASPYSRHLPQLQLQLQQEQKQEEEEEEQQQLLLLSTTFYNYECEYEYEYAQRGRAEATTKLRLGSCAAIVVAAAAGFAGCGVLLISCWFMVLIIASLPVSQKDYCADRRRDEYIDINTSSGLSTQSTAGYGQAQEFPSRDSVHW